MSPSLNPIKLALTSLHDNFIFFRCKDWPHLLGLIILGFAISPSTPTLSACLLALMIGSLYLAHGYSINDVYDDHVKIKTPRKNALLRSLTALALCFILSWSISLAYFLAVLTGHLSGMLYSVFPFRFKNKLGLDLIFNALALAPLFLLGYLLNNNFDPKAAGITILFFIYFIPIQLIHEINDTENDQRDGQNNTFQILGRNKTKNLLFLSLIIYSIYSLILWKNGILKTPSTAINLLFALSTGIYAQNIWPKLFKQGSISIKQIKLDVRSISICYGIGLLLSFHLTKG